MSQRDSKAACDGQPIVYVEDEENDVFLLQYGLEKAQVNRPLKVLNNGKDAVNYLSQASKSVSDSADPPPCLLLLDVNLPQLSGIEVLQWLREKDQLPGVPVVFLTSSEQPQDLQRAKDLGASGYLLKPADPALFVELALRLKRQWLERPPGQPLLKQFDKPPPGP